jgi:hypothetical protein
MIDLVKSIFIFGVFMILTATTLFSTGMQNLKDNWPIYRCNPIIMPIAGFIGDVSTEENFSFCIQDTMSALTPALTQPFAYMQDLSTNTLQNLVGSMSSAQGEQSSMRFNFGGIITTLYDTFLNVIIQFNTMFLKLKDTQGKLVGVVTVMLYVITLAQYTFQGMWDGIPGKLIRSFDKF